MEHNQNTFVVKKSNNIGGTISVKGAKNHALKMLAASVLSTKEWKITNLPRIEDIKRKEELLRSLGVVIKNGDGEAVINAKDISSTKLDPKMSSTIRTSIVLAAALLSRFGKVSFYHPGGCVLGKRPIDIFLNGFKALGATLSDKGDFIELKAPGGRLKGSTFFFPRISVTGTEAMILAGVLANGTTILKNAALEPEIKAMADFLNSCGAKIEGAGTSTIKIKGVKSIKGGECKIVPDRIEMATFVILGALHKKKLNVVNCDPTLAESLWKTLESAGCKLKIGKDKITCLPYKNLVGTDVITHEYPGFATDFQPPYTVLATQAKGSSLIHDPIFEGRLFFADSLVQMGANINMCDPHRIIVQGPTPLMGKKLASPDIRAGIALVLAGTIAKGETIINNVYQIDRGYENIDKRFKNIGVDIQRF